MFPSPSTMSSSSASPMSEPGPSPGPSAQKVKQRRPNRSCDTCRTRKSNAPKDAPCSNCVDFGATCTYLELPKKRGPKNRLVDELRKQNASLEARLRAASVCALCSQPLDRDRPTPFRNEHTTGSHMISPQEWNEDDEDDDELTAKLSQFSISAMKNKYFGTVSTYSLANNAIQAKETKVGRPMAANYKRMVFWQTPAWEKAYYNDQPHYTFPEDDLMVSLVQLYFDRIHPTFPILHRPTFQRSLAEGLHFRDPHFATMLLALLAMASRHSNDPRVFADGYSAASAGWKFVAQTQPLRKTFEPSIYHVQFYAASFLAFRSLFRLIGRPAYDPVSDRNGASAGLLVLSGKRAYTHLSGTNATSYRV
ncbi:unnamed protein product [Mycena citricolor]|uniref:Zn(2)-C6 fungal-type domain-containing protein n=1 Tax=Mycena citricolor TaxID=2018698 RepID=A0AAD2I0P1_9AGAR|nr:unnamed protein product [Mycena citricolor]